MKNIFHKSCFSKICCFEESFKKILKEHKKILVVEDHFNIGGIYDEIIKSLYKNKFLADIKHISVHDYAQAADPKELYKSYKTL